MNEIQVTVSFSNQYIRIGNYKPINNDYNSAKMVFNFEEDLEGTKILEIRPKNATSNDATFVSEIINNEVILTKLNEDEENCSIFTEAGDHILEISLYGDDSKLSSVAATFRVLEEQVIVGDETITAYLPIFDQLMNKLNTAIGQINKKPYYFNNVADMKNYDLNDGDSCITLGYYSINDGGSALYKIRTITNSDVVDDGSIIALNDNLIAELIIIDNNINVEQFGAKGDGTTNDYALFKKCFDFANEHKYNISLLPKTYNIIGNRLILKTSLNGNNATIISNDNEENVNLDEPLIHVVSDSEFSSTPINNAYIFRTYPEHSNIWKRTGNTQEAQNGTVAKECNVIIKNNLLYNYFFDFANPVESYRKLDDNIVIKDLNIDKTIVNNLTRTTYMKRNILIERDNVLIDNVNFNITDNTTNVTPYLGLINLNKCYNVRLNNCIIPALLTNSSYSLHTSYDIKTMINNCYINGEYDCWGGTSSNGTVDITYSNCNVNRIDAHEGFFGLTVKDCYIGKEGILLTGGNYADIEHCRFNGRRCIALREDYGSGFNGIIRLKNCDGDISTGEIIYLKSTTDFDYGYDWKCPNVEIEDCNFNTTTGRIDVFAYTVNTNTDLTWLTTRNTIKINNLATNKNIRLFENLPLLFGDFEIKLENLYIRNAMYNSIIKNSTNNTMYVNANKCTIRYPKNTALERINGTYINCEMLDLEFIHLNTSLIACNLMSRDNITCGYTNSGKHLSMVNFSNLIYETDVTAWHENCYNFKV